MPKGVLHKVLREEEFKKDQEIKDRPGYAYGDALWAEIFDTIDGEYVWITGNHRLDSKFYPGGREFGDHEPDKLREYIRNFKEQKEEV